jgi:hypothetical protein
MSTTKQVGSFAQLAIRGHVSRNEENLFNGRAVARSGSGSYCGGGSDTLMLSAIMTPLRRFLGTPDSGVRQLPKVHRHLVEQWQ